MSVLRPAPPAGTGEAKSKQAQPDRAKSLSARPQSFNGVRLPYRSRPRSHTAFEIDRKVLSELAITQPDAFKAIVEKAKSALPAFAFNGAFAAIPAHARP